MPPDIPASLDIPMIIVGGRFLLPKDTAASARLFKKIEANNPINRPQNTNAERE